ncbi:MAG: choice-of-anchor L domain-containing protein, partial [Flavobacteriales bacterium]|nr:choice-of-anchor L domain-containing protein [Flavobacteriales bacterium]
LAIARSVTSNPDAGNITSTNDRAFLEFDFTPVGDTVEFRFVFASEEYTSWINSVYNDIFAFFVSGPGISGPYASPAAFQFIRV